MAPDAVASGVVIAGTHPAAVDCVAATIMGFDWRRIRMLKGCFEMKQLSFVDFGAADIRVVSNKAEWNGGLDQISGTHHFRPHFGWVGAIEKRGPTVAP